MKHKDKDKFAYTIFNVLTLKHAAAAKSLQSCPTLCDPRDSSPPGFPVPGILQARTLEWIAISFSNAWKWKIKVKSLSRVRLFETPWTAAYQAPLSMDFPGRSTGVGCHCLLQELLLSPCLLSGVSQYCSNSKGTGTLSFKLKDAYSLEEKHDQPRQHI